MRTQKKGTGPDKNPHLVSLHDEIEASCYLNKDARLDPRPIARPIARQNKYLEVENRGFSSVTPQAPIRLKLIWNGTMPIGSYWRPQVWQGPLPGFDRQWRTVKQAITKVVRRDVALFG